MNNRGFTLIELILVIAILGILAVAAMPKIISITETAHEAVIAGVLGQLQAATMLKEAQDMAKFSKVMPIEAFDSVEAGKNCDLDKPCFADFLKDPITKQQWTK
ncbi:type II secretion system GspH family protein, partial [bacterium]|nr:type II secretion system GspH family protein [bacterium]